MFPANIVGVNRTIFLPEESPALSVFIAWINLDFGIEACFHDGMDAYTKTFSLAISQFADRFAS